MFGFDNFMFPSLSGWSSMANIYEDSEHYVIELRATGLKKEDIEITFGRGGESIIIKSKPKDERKNTSYTRREFWRDRIDREYVLPEGIDYDKISAKTEDGILYIYIPKKKREYKPESRKFIEVM